MCPDRTVTDEIHEDYVYTRAWVEKLARELGNQAEYEHVTGRQIAITPPP